MGYANAHLVRHWGLTGLRCSFRCPRGHLSVEGDCQAKGSLDGLVRINNALRKLVAKSDRQLYVFMCV